MHFSFEKYVLTQVLKNFSVENLENTPSTFLSKFSSEIYLSRIINYLGSIFTLYLTWGAFSLVCVLSIFFSFFFFFYWYFPWQTQITAKGEEILIFLVFHFKPLTNIHLVYRDFYHFYLNRSIRDYQSDSWFVLRTDFHFNCILLMSLSRSYINFDISRRHCKDLTISNYHPSIRKQTP